MMNYQTPSLKVVDFELVNVVLASTSTTACENETPIMTRSANFPE